MWEIDFVWSAYYFLKRENDDIPKGGSTRHSNNIDDPKIWIVIS
jgi:hypothetical protein